MERRETPPDGRPAEISGNPENSMVAATAGLAWPERLPSMNNIDLPQASTPEIPPYLSRNFQVPALHVNPNYQDSPLEAEFSRLSLTMTDRVSQPSAPAPLPESPPIRLGSVGAGEGFNSSLERELLSQLQDLRRLRIQSAVNGQPDPGRYSEHRPSSLRGESELGLNNYFLGSAFHHRPTGSSLTNQDGFVSHCQNGYGARTWSNTNWHINRPAEFYPANQNGLGSSFQNAYGAHSGSGFGPLYQNGCGAPASSGVGTSYQNEFGSSHQNGDGALTASGFGSSFQRGYLVNQNGFGSSSPNGSNRSWLSFGTTPSRPSLPSMSSGFCSNCSLSSRISSISDYYEMKSLEDVRGRLVLIAKEQKGCRFLHEKFEKGSGKDRKMIFDELKSYLTELMVHQFGNYLVQKLFDFCSPGQITEVLYYVLRDARRLLRICSDNHGTRAMQKLLKYATAPEQRSLVVSGVRCITVDLAKSSNGHHVIAHCVRSFSAEENKDFYKAMIENCLEVSMDRYGCCVIQTCVKHAEGEMKEQLIAEITSIAYVLAEHPYGNYVVQNLLEMGIPSVNANVLAQLAGNYVSLSTNKFGSNVVEKCLKSSEQHLADLVIEEIIQSENLLALLQDQFGNYVAQTALEVSKGALRDALVSIILKHYCSLHSHPFGKKVLEKAKGGRRGL